MHSKPFVNEVPKETNSWQKSRLGIAEAKRLIPTLDAQLLKKTTDPAPVPQSTGNC